MFAVGFKIPATRVFQNGLYHLITSDGSAPKFTTTKNRGFNAVRILIIIIIYIYLPRRADSLYKHIKYIGVRGGGGGRSNGLNYKNSLRSASTDKTTIVETCFTFKQTNFESNL